MSNANSPLNPPAGQIEETDAGTVISETQVKQGRRGSHTFVILIASLSLAVILVFGLWAFKSSDLKAADHSDSSSKAAASRTFDTGPSQPKPGAADNKSPT